MLSHDLGLEFLSPTINMFFSAKDFIKFVKNISVYIDCKFIDVTTENDQWPVAQLGDILLQLVHYHSVSEAQEAWNRRKARINWDKLFIIMNDRNGCTENELKEFEELDYENKVFFTCNKVWSEKYESAFYISKSEVSDGVTMVKTMTSFDPKWGWHRVVDEFDYVGFLNRIE